MEWLDEDFEEEKLLKSSPPLKSECKFCSRTFKIKKNRLRHQATCQQKSITKEEKQLSAFTCSVCNAKYFKKKSLESHIIAGTCQARRPKKLKDSASLTKQVCKFCLKEYKNNRSRLNHQYLCHKNPNKRSRPLNHKCPKCDAAFSKKIYMEAHVAAGICRAKQTYTCQQPDCDFTYRYKSVLNEHLREVHNIDISPPERMVFADWTEFRAWKETEESKTFSYFSQQFGVKGGRYWYFYCQKDGNPNMANRSGQSDETKELGNVPSVVLDEVNTSTVVDEVNTSVEISCQNINTSLDMSSTNDGKKRAKKRPNLKGRVKTGAICTSMMKIKQQNDGTLALTYFPSHTHPLSASDLKHQPIDPATSELIRQQLSLGVTPLQIKRSLQGEKFARANRSLSDLSTTPSRNDFISLHSIQERKRIMLKTQHLAPPENNGASIVSLVKHLREEPYDPVLIFKPAGQKLVSGPKSALDLPMDCFILGLQTKEQLDLMKEFSKEILIIDATHDIEIYGCQLLNIIGVDEFNRGYPLAHCLSSNMDEETLKHFFLAIKRRAPDLKVNCIISADNPALINATRSGLNDYSILHLLCLWHFKRTLQRQVRAKIHDQNLETEIVKKLCNLIDSRSESDFNILLLGFKQEYGNCLQTSIFFKYLEETCMPKKEKWATCFRTFPHKNVHTTLYVETFHNFLKNMYLKEKPIKSVNTLTNYLLSIEEEYFCWRVKTSTTHGDEAFSKNLNGRHEQSVRISDSKIVEVVEDTQWKIKPESAKNKNYDVLRTSYECAFPEQCYFRCNGSLCANLCSHMYVCSCTDEIPLCKHVHKVHAMSLKKSKAKKAFPLSIEEEPEPQSDEHTSYIEAEVDWQNDGEIVIESTSFHECAPSDRSYPQVRVYDEIRGMMSELGDLSAQHPYLQHHIKDALEKLLAECRAVQQVHY